jgi:hypothetical protein
MESTTPLSAAMLANTTPVDPTTSLLAPMLVWDWVVAATLVPTISLLASMLVCVTPVAVTISSLAPVLVTATTQVASTPLLDSALVSAPRPTTTYS